MNYIYTYKGWRIYRLVMEEKRYKASKGERFFYGNSQKEIESIIDKGYHETFGTREYL